MANQKDGPAILQTGFVVSKLFQILKTLVYQVLKYSILIFRQTILGKYLLSN